MQRCLVWLRITRFLNALTGFLYFLFVRIILHLYFSLHLSTWCEYTTLIQRAQSTLRLRDLHDGHQNICINSCWRCGRRVGCKEADEQARRIVIRNLDEENKKERGRHIERPNKKLYYLRIEHYNWMVIQTWFLPC